MQYLTKITGLIIGKEPDELVDYVVIDHDQPVRVQSRIESMSGTFVTMNVNITALCAQNFEGSDCTQCIPGANCDVNIDDCVGVSCGSQIPNCMYLT